MPEINFSGPTGRLQGRYDQQADPNAAVALFLHPHPKLGGTMNNRVIYHLFYALSEVGVTVLRFNFRGVGRSEGEHSGETGELSDSAAALSFLQSRNPNARACIVVGFSYGAYIAMQLLMRRPEITGFVCISPVVNVQDFSFLAPCPTSGLIVSGSADLVASPGRIADLAKQLQKQEEVEVVHRVVEGAGHFFEGTYMQELQIAVVQYVQTNLYANLF
ncbi:MAG: alpha/beta hydrolase [Rhodobacteraceae bacterium]|nr:alpha/beta hydrolase [Paracoccaceae bacterium]